MALNWKGNSIEIALDDYIRTVLEDVGEEMVKEARRRAPIDTGEHRDSIRYEIDERDLSVKLVADSDHSVYLEDSRYKSAQPSLIPTLEESAKIVERAIRR